MVYVLKGGHRRREGGGDPGFLVVTRIPGAAQWVVSKERPERLCELSGVACPGRREAVLQPPMVSKCSNMTSGIEGSESHPSLTAAVRVLPIGIRMAGEWKGLSVSLGVGCLHSELALTAGREIAYAIS